jgi:hypothetical protein
MVLGLLILTVEAWGADKIEGVLSLRDGLTSPGRPVRLEARLVRSGVLGLQAGLGGEQVEFSVNRHSIGTSMTGGDGRAILEYTPRMRGNQEVTVNLTANPRVNSQPAKGMLFSWERRRPILLVEVLALVEPAKSSPSVLPSLPLDLGLSQPPVPVPEAAEELKRLTEYFYNVIYVARIDGAGSGEDGALRDWLSQNHFPPGVAIRLKSGAQALNEKLDELKSEGWDNLKAGIGRTRSFAEVLSERRMPVIIMPDSNRDGEKLPRKTMVIDNWKEVRKKLQG